LILGLPLDCCFVMLNRVKSEGFAEGNHLFYKQLDPSLRSGWQRFHITIHYH